MKQSAHTIPFIAIGRDDVASGGGKNSSLGEMVRHLGQRGLLLHLTSGQLQSKSIA